MEIELMIFVFFAITTAGGALILLTIAGHDNEKDERGWHVVFLGGHERYGVFGFGFFINALMRGVSDGG